MNSANCESARDLESKLAYHPTSSFLDEKRSLKSDDEKKSDKMSKVQHRIFAFLLFCLFAVGVFAATLNTNPPDAAKLPSPDQTRFQQLLNSVDPSALREVLLKNMKDKYRHGVFLKDKNAVEAIHQQDAEVAESLIELAKRQATGSGNGTVVTTTAVVTTDTVITTTASVTSTDSTASPPTTSSSQLSKSLPPPPPPPTTQQTTSSAPVSSPSPSLPASTLTEVSTSTAPPTVASTSSSESSSVPSSSVSISEASTSGPSSESSSGSSSESSSESQAAQTTPSSSRTTVFTSTMPNGGVVTVTSVTVVPAGQADQTSKPASTTRGSNASLQTGDSTKIKVGLSAIFGVVGLVVIGDL